MPPYNTDERVQGLHYLSVVDAAKALAAVLSGNKLMWEKFRSSPIEAPLHDLVREVNRLSMFERRAAVRGTVKTTEGEDVARAVKEARDRPDVSLEAKDILEAVEHVDDEDLFSLENEDPAREAFEGAKARSGVHREGEVVVFDPERTKVFKKAEAGDEKPKSEDSDLDSFEV